jgi:hypothetical protein
MRPAAGRRILNVGLRALRTLGAAQPQLGPDVRVQVAATSEDGGESRGGIGTGGRGGLGSVGTRGGRQFMRMLLADKPPRLIRGSSYVKIEAIKLLYEILSIKIMSDLDIQSFFFLVKRSAEELGFPV